MLWTYGSKHLTKERLTHVLQKTLMVLLEKLKYNKWEQLPGSTLIGPISALQNK
jgi:hypothetical protein